MSAPPAIIDALSSVIEIYFSGVRHRERAAFILCDNLVEMTCKTRAREYNRKFDITCSFYDAWKAPGVALPQRTLGRRVQGYRDVRNNMQHASPAATVDGTYCATAILTAVEVIERCWPNTSKRLPPWMKVAVRVLKLYSDDGDARQRADFENTMQNQNWRTDGRTHILVSEMTFKPGNRDNWGVAIKAISRIVEECLNQIGVPD